MMIVRKRRKLINGFNITLLEKSVDILTDPRVQPIDTADSGGKFLRSENKDIQNTGTGLFEPTNTLLGINDTQIQYLAVPLDEPKDSQYLSWNEKSGTTVWKQLTNYQPQIDVLTDVVKTSSSNISEIQTQIIQFNNIVRTDFVESNLLHLPFAVAWSANSWGGPGKAGIFWSDPGTTPVDNFSIKFGGTNLALGESNYDFGTVGTASTAYPSSNAVVMKFSNGTEGARGFVWNAVGISGGPVMALDTDPNRSDSPYNRGGNLTVRNRIITHQGCFQANGYSQIPIGTTQYLGNLHVNEHNPYLQYPLPTPIITLRPSLGSEYNGYVMTYREGNLYGEIGLSPSVGGSGSGTLPGVEIDCGSFTAGTADINCGSFV